MREFELLYEFGDSKYCEKEEICVDMVRGKSRSTGAANVVQTPRFVSDVQNLETSVASSVQTPSFPF